MYMYLLLVSFSSVALAQLWSQRTCSRWRYPYPFTEGKYIVSPYYSSYNIQILQCVQLCMRHIKCKSINYNSKKPMCSLFSQESKDHVIIKAVNHHVYSNVNDWPRLTLAYQCWNHSCPSNSVCNPDKAGKGYACDLLGCYVEDSSNPAKDRIAQLGSEVIPNCDFGYYPTLRQRCFINGSIEKGACTPNPSTCSKLKACNNGYTDGEYWIYHRFAFKAKKIKIFCGQMESSSPAAYITLQYPSKELQYSKYECEGPAVTYNISRLRLKNGTDKWHGHFLIDAITGEDDCVLKGVFIDLRNTSFKFAPVISKITNTSQVLNITCDTCERNIGVVLNYTYSPKENTATMPLCKDNVTEPSNDPFNRTSGLSHFNSV